MNKYIPPPQEPEHDESYIKTHTWLAKRLDVRAEDKDIISLIMMLQNNPNSKIKGRCFASQRRMAEMLGFRLNTLNLAIARLCQQDVRRKTGRKTRRQNPFYSQPLIFKAKTRHPDTKKLITVYWVSLEKDMPLWWMREDSEGRAGIKDIRSVKSHDFTQKENLIVFPKINKKSS